MLAAPSGLYLHCLAHKHPSFPFSWLPQQFRSAPFPNQYPLPPLTPYIMDNFSFLKQLPGFKGSQFIYRKDADSLAWLSSPCKRAPTYLARLIPSTLASRHFLRLSLCPGTLSFSVMSVETLCTILGLTK